MTASSTELEPWKRRALEMFTAAMHQQLIRPENSTKGGWEGADTAQLMNEVWYHAAKLLKAVETLEDRQLNVARHGEHGIRQARIALLEFAADVGNCAMIVAEVTDALELAWEPEVGESGEEKVEWSHRYRRYGP